VEGEAAEQECSRSTASCKTPTIHQRQPAGSLLDPPTDTHTHHPSSGAGRAVAGARVISRCVSGNAVVEGVRLCKRIYETVVFTGYLRSAPDYGRCMLQPRWLPGSDHHAQKCTRR
jgi:hypothetical protein